MTTLTCRSLDKQFGGIVALDGLSVTVDCGEITGLVGPNGAGKTTLFDVLSGLTDPDSGAVAFDGEDVTHLPPHRRCHVGLARTFQTPRPIRSLTVAENLQVARRFGTDADHDDALRERVLDALGLAATADTSADDLQLVERKRLDLARALMTDPDLVLVDELLAGLTPTEKSELADAVRDLRETFDVGLLVVEHDLAAVRSLADTVVAVTEGRHLATGSPETVLADDAVREAYVGE